MYIYPENLKAKPMLWLWLLRDIAIIGVAALISVLSLVQGVGMAPLVVTVLYAFLSIQVDGASILDFLRRLQKWKERKRLKQRQSTRQLMGIRKLLPHGVAIPGGSLVFFLIHPDNLSVLSAEGIRQRVTALSNLFRAEEQVEVLGLDSTC